MTLSDLAAIGSFVSGIAVLISLIYVALQIRQTERNQRTLLQQGTSSRGTQVLIHFARKDIAELFVKAGTGEADFTAVQAQQFILTLRAALLGFQDQFLLHGHSLIDPRQREGQELAIGGMFITPAARAGWGIMRPTFPVEFAGYVDGIVARVPLAKSADIGALLNAALTELKTGAGE
jgi:hypothetical protein